MNYRQAYGIFACSGILFNHESPRRGETFVTKKIINAALKIAEGKTEILYLGNLNAYRDWGHAKDYVDGMWRILQYPSPDDWVLATGVATTVREFVNLAFAKLGTKITWQGNGIEEKGVDQNNVTRVLIDPRYFRPAEVPHLLGDASKAQRLLGWKPTYSLEDLIDDMIQNT